MAGSGGAWRKKQGHGAGGFGGSGHGAEVAGILDAVSVEVKAGIQYGSCALGGLPGARRFGDGRDSLGSIRIRLLAETLGIDHGCACAGLVLDVIYEIAMPGLEVGGDQEVAQSETGLGGGRCQVRALEQDEFGVPPPMRAAQSPDRSDLRIVPAADHRAGDVMARRRRAREVPGRGFCPGTC